MKNKNTILTFIVSVIFVTIVIVLFVFIVKVIQNKNEHTLATLVAIGEKTKEKESTIMFAEKVKEIKSIQDEVNRFLVDQNKIDKFVGYLENLSKDVGGEISIKGIEIPPKTKNIVLFKLSIKGNFNQVISNLTLLENIPYQITITQVYLNKEIKQQEEESKLSKSLPTLWKADVFFSILSLK